MLKALEAEEIDTQPPENKKLKPHSKEKNDLLSLLNLNFLIK